MYPEQIQFKISIDLHWIHCRNILEICIFPRPRTFEEASFLKQIWFSPTYYTYSLFRTCFLEASFLYNLHTIRAGHTVLCHKNVCILFDI